MRDDRDDLAQMLLRYGIANGDKWAEVVNALTMYPDGSSGDLRQFVSK